jgi:hypothetical protein
MKWNKKYIILAILLPIQMLLMRLADNNPTFIEQYYSNGVYTYISSFLRILFGWIPFSVGDLLIAFLVFIFIRFIFILIKSRFRNFIPKMIHFTAIISILYFCFYFFWGLNYYREPLAENLNYKQTKYTTEDLVKTTEYVLKELNSLQFKITKNDTIAVNNNYTEEEIYNKSLQGFKNLSIEFNQLHYTYKSVKSSLMSYLQSYNGTSGYLNPLTGEAQVNDRMPKTGYPTTTCHEMAHQIGFAAENEANFIGFLAANYNDDLYFKYASYRMAFSYCMSEIRKRDKEIYNKIWAKTNKGVVKDFNTSYNFWKSYKNPLEPYIKKGYSAYLKANKQSKGTDSYNYVVDLLISHFRASYRI